MLALKIPLYLISLFLSRRRGGSGKGWRREGDSDLIALRDLPGKGLKAVSSHCCCSAETRFRVLNGVRGREN